MGIIRGFVSRDEYINKAMEFFNYGFKIDTDKMSEENLDRIHRLLAELEHTWNITALEIGGSLELYRKMTHADERGD
jgi:hypothetical protein